MANFADSIRQKLWTPNDIASLLEGLVGDSTNIHPATFTSWSPTYTGRDSMTYTSVTTTMAMYAKFGKIVFMQFAATGTVGGTPSYDIYVSYPSGITPNMGAAESVAFPAVISDSGQVDASALFGTSGIAIRKGSGNYNAGASKYIAYSGFFRCT